MTDNKINMSLDEIIKSERKIKKNIGSKIKRNKVAGGRKFVAGRKRGRNVKLNAATVSAVNKLVKRAISRRVNQRLIQRAANRRLKVSQVVTATRPAGFRSRRAFNRSRQQPANRLRGISQKSRVILSGGARRAQNEEPLVFSSNVKEVRGRGTARLGQLISDSAPIVVQREILPVMNESVIERAPRSYQNARKRQVIVQRRRANRPMIVRRRVATRPVVVERTAYVPAIRNRGIAKRLSQSQYVTYNTRRNQPLYERIQHIKNVDRQIVKSRPNRRRQFVLNPNAAQMREALGIGKAPNRNVQRFEPSSSFLQRVPVNNRKGRGFRNPF